MYQINLEFGPVEYLSRPPQSRYEINWYDEYGFDYRYPFREIFDHIMRELKRENSQVELNIDDYWENEDFIDFILEVDRKVFARYFEHSLCVLTFSYEDQDALSKFRESANRVMFFSEGYEESWQF